EPLKHVIRDPLTDPARAAHQTRLALAPLGVPRLGATGLSAALVTGHMLTGRKGGEEASIRTPMVRAYRLILIVRRHIRPTKGQHRVRAVAQGKAQDLPHPARHRDPEPQWRREAYTDLVDLNHVLCGRRYRGQGWYLL